MLNEMKLEVVENFAGDKDKDGVVLKCKSGFNYYKGSGDSSLARIVVEKGYTRSKDGTSLVKTSKVYEPVTVANNKMTVTVYPDGRLEIVPN